MNSISTAASQEAERQYEILLRFIYRGLRAGVEEKIFCFKEWRLHKALPFVLEYLAMRHIRSLGFRCDEDRRYPAISLALSRMIKEGWVTFNSDSESGPIYAFTPLAVETLRSRLGNPTMLDEAESAAIEEAFHHGYKAFVGNADYEECLRETGHLD
ncbi:MAG: hypothetical protein V4465_02525 [Patescibacteria group bacterium]